MKIHFPVLLSFAVVLSSSFSAAANEPYSIEVEEKPRYLHDPNLSFIRVRILDVVLTFRLNSDLARTTKGYVPSLEIPPHLRLQNRNDLIPVVEEILGKGEEPLVARFVAWYLLPHIDDPKAAAILVGLPTYDPDGISIRWAKDLPLPEDAVRPPMWIRHAGNDVVLDGIEKHLRTLAEPASPSYFPFWLLAASDSPRALSMLDQLIKADPELKVSNLGALLDDGHPVSQTAWTYITASIKEHCERVTPDRNGLWTMDFFDLRGSEKPEEVIQGFSQSDLDTLAAVYLDNLLESPGFDRVMSAWIYYGDAPDTASRQDMVSSYSSYRDLCGFCERYGSARHIWPLKTALRAFEDAFFGAELERGIPGFILRETEGRLTWDYGCCGGTSGPGYEDARESYETSRAAALKAMESREY